MTKKKALLYALAITLGVSLLKIAGPAIKVVCLSVPAIQSRIFPDLKPEDCRSVSDFKFDTIL